MWVINWFASIQFLYTIYGVNTQASGGTEEKQSVRPLVPATGDIRYNQWGREGGRSPVERYMCNAWLAYTNYVCKCT